MSVQALAWALSVSTGSVSRKAVLISLANCHNAHSSKCCPRLARIAAETDLSERTVKRALEDLVEGGWIERDRRRRADGTLSVYDFVLKMDKLTDPGDTLAPDPGDTVAPQEPEVNLEPSEVPNGTSAHGTDSAQKTPLQLLFDACEEHTQKAPVAKSPRAAYAKLVREMLAAGWTPEMVRSRAKRYRRRFPSMELTVAALAKWGEELDRGKRTLTEGNADNGARHGDDGAGVPSVSVLPPAENARRMRELAERTVGALDGAGAFLSTPAPSSALPSADPTGAPGEPVHPSAGSPHPS